MVSITLFSLESLKTPLIVVFALIVLVMIWIFRNRISKKNDKIIKIFFVSSMISLEVTFLILSYLTSGLNKDHIPFELCSVIMWATVYALISGNYNVFKIIGPWSVIGAFLAFSSPSMGILEVQYPIFRNIHFYGLHSLFLFANMYIFMTKQVENYHIKDVRKSVLVLLIYASIVGVFDYVFKYNYLFIVELPGAASSLHNIVPKPYHVIPGVFVIVGLIYLTFIPLKYMTRSIDCENLQKPQSSH